MDSILFVSYKDLKVHALNHISDMLDWVFMETINLVHPIEKPYMQDWSTWEHDEIREEVDIIARKMTRILAVHDKYNENMNALQNGVTEISSDESGGDAILKNYMSSIRTILNMANQGDRLFARKNSFCELSTSDNGVFLKPSASLQTEDCTKLVNHLRNLGLRPTVVEHIAIYLASHQDHKRLTEDDAVGWLPPGSGTHQTIMSITDPGLGHIYGTCLDQRNLDGIIIHVEHLERGVRIPRKIVEPYRIPDPSLLKRIMFMSGGYVPVSTYIGRPIFEGNFKESFIKTVRTFASACSFFFSLGVTECKVSVENMTAKESIKFLRTLDDITVKRSYQIISAAFCINENITNDLGDTVEIISAPFEVGLLGIKIVNQSGLKKIAWDGTADEYPSRCIIEQLGFKSALRLVHEAHQLGLLTYFSAGFRFNHIESAVYAGVDGIGIGGAQILRYMDNQTGNHGPFISGNIQKILATRNLAESTVIGRSARFLSYLDSLYNRGQCISNCNELRVNLFDMLLQEEEKELLTILSSGHAITIMSNNGNN